MKIPYIVDIKENSLDDGPGIRSVIYFKGCPLSCNWCHNPEAQNVNQELVFQKNNCIHCLPKCLVQCPNKAFDYLNMKLDRELCTLSRKCVIECPANVFSITGKLYEISELVQRFKSNITFYNNSNGGVTLTGGEPMLFPEYILELLQQLRNNNIGIVIETCGVFPLKSQTKQIIEQIQYLYYDIKLMDNTEHKTYCGISNEKILENFTRLITDGYVELPASKQDLEIRKSYEKPLLIPRVPLIPDITTKKHNLQKICAFFKEFRIKVIDLLPYNPLWLNKSSALGLIHKYTRDSWMTQQELTYVHSYFRDFEFDTFKI